MAKNFPEGQVTAKFAVEQVQSAFEQAWSGGRSVLKAFPKNVQPEMQTGLSDDLYGLHGFTASLLGTLHFVIEHRRLNSATGPSYGQTEPQTPANEFSTSFNELHIVVSSSQEGGQRNAAVSVKTNQDEELKLSAQTETIDDDKHTRFSIATKFHDSGVHQRDLEEKDKKSSKIILSAHTAVSDTKTVYSAELPYMASGPNLSDPAQNTLTAEPSTAQINAAALELRWTKENIGPIIGRIQLLQGEYHE